MRFAVAVDIAVPKGANTTALAHELLEMVTRPSNWEKHLHITNLSDEGHTTEQVGNQPMPRHHFGGYAVEPAPLFGKKRRSQVQVSYIQDPICPEVRFTIKSPSTRYYTRVFRVMEHEVAGETLLEVKCDVVIEHKSFFLAACRGVSSNTQHEHERLLQAIKLEFESQY